MNRLRRTSFDETKVRIRNILFSSQSSRNTNNGKVDTESATKDSPTSKQGNVGQRKPPQKRGGRKNVVANSKQQTNTTAAAKNASKSKTAGRRGRKKSEQSVNVEHLAERTTARPRKQYVPNGNARYNTRSRSTHEAEAALNAESTEPVEHSVNERENEKQGYNLRGCAIVINRLTPQEVDNVSTVRESENDENITSPVTESQRQLSVASTESIHDELGAQAIQEAAKSAPEQSEKNDKVTHETHRARTPAQSETDDENLDYIQMTMTSEDEGDGDEMPGFTSNNNSQHDSVQNGDSGYQTGNKSTLSNVQEWLNKSFSPDALSDAADVPDVVPTLPEHEIILNVCRLSKTPSNLTMITVSMSDKEKDSVIPFDHQSQISTHFSGTRAKSVDNLSVTSTHFYEEPDREHEPISQVAVPADERSDITPVNVSNLNKSISNATTHFSEDKQVLERNTSTISVQMDDFNVAGSNSNRTISVENVSNVSSAKRSRDKEELDALHIADEQILNATEDNQRSQPDNQFSHPILQPRPKRPRTGSVIQVSRGKSEPNRRIVSQPTRDPPEFDPNDVQHSSQPFAIVVSARFRPTSQNNNNNNDDGDSLLIDTPSDTDYQESNHQRFITQPTQLTHMNWGFSRNSSLETILATNSSNVSATPKYRYNRHQEDQTCFPMVPHTYYNSLVINGETTFAVNDFDHGNANIKHHFLSRFNDSSNGLNANFNGIVYTTSITANLISHYMNVDRSRIIILEFNETIIVENIRVTALELTSWPGATLFAFDTGSNGIILHVGDLRIPADTEGIEYLVMNRIKKFYFDRSCLMKVYYHIPNDIDRYVGLIDQCTKYYQQNITVGMIGMIVIGAFTHGMEPLILHLAEMLHMKVYMDVERRAFLDRMLDNDIQPEDSVHYRLRERVVANPRKGHLHILDVDHINETYLSGYLSNNMNASFNRMLAIRPRGNGSHHIQLALNRYIRILDIPNPLVGDYHEYRRFMESVRENPEQEQRPRQLS